jgi:hypothetical protein
MSSIDYLVICGRASARRCNPRASTSDIPLDSSKQIIAQFLYPVQCPLQCCLIQGLQLSASFVHQSGF